MNDTRTACSVPRHCRGTRAACRSPLVAAQESQGRTRSTSKVFMPGSYQANDTPAHVNSDAGGIPRRSLVFLAPPGGFEPPTHGLGTRRSRGVFVQVRRGDEGRSGTLIPKPSQYCGSVAVSGGEMMGRG